MDKYIYSLKNKSFDENVEFIKSLKNFPYDSNVSDLVAHMANVVSELSKAPAVNKVLWIGFIGDAVSSVDEACRELTRMDAYPVFTVNGIHGLRSVEMAFTFGGVDYTYTETNEDFDGHFMDEKEWLANRFINRQTIWGIMTGFNRYVTSMTHDTFVRLASETESISKFDRVARAHEVLDKEFWVFSDYEFHMQDVVTMLAENSTREEPYSFEEMCRAAYNSLGDNGELMKLIKSRPKEILVVSAVDNTHGLYAGKDFSDLASRLADKLPFRENKLGKILVEVRRMCGN